jgi:Ni,Fe-hydrogenase III small subunit
VLRGLRDGVVTTRWPSAPDEYEEQWRGPAVVTGGPLADAAGLAELCPAGAITERGPDGVAIDQGRCILCGRCVLRRPDVFGWSAGAAGLAGAAITRPGLVVPAPPESPAGLATVRAALAGRTSALRRSVHLRHVDTGSDGGEELEIAALLNPVYDIHRLGMFFTASPRHADVLLVTGAGARGMAGPLRRTYEGMPDPKIVIAVGADAISGGLIGGEPGGVGGVVPVDVWVPGSPPPPFAILHGLLAGLGRLPAREEAGGPRR